MLKKTLYTIFALSAVITIGMATSGFIRTTTATETAAETTIETPTPFAGTWIAGRVSADGEKLSGTGSWTVLKPPSSRYAGIYHIKPDNGKVVSIVATLMGRESSTSISKYNCLVSYEDDDRISHTSIYGAAKVYTYDPFDNQFNSGNDRAFSFIAYVE